MNDHRPLLDKVALVTGAARGIGRAHAVRLAEAGADVVVTDICQDEGSLPYGLATQADLDETARLVAQLGRRALTRQVDVRDQSALDAAVADAMAEFGRLDVVVPNAGLVSFGRSWELTENQWQTAIDVMVTGVWHTTKAAIPSMIEAGRGGAIVMIGSVNSLKPARQISHYVTAKHAMVGFMKSVALEVAEFSIRVNLVAPGTVETDMATSTAILRRYRPDLDNPTTDDVDAFLRSRHPLPTRSIGARDISNAVVWLASDEARYITGTVLPVDAGWLAN